MSVKAKLPMGIENFREMRTQGYYYIDKTRLIQRLLDNFGKVSLFTRPRRFGKTLNMSMLKYFFEIGSERALFDGLEISGEKELCDAYMGKFPVISVTLKGATGENFSEAKGMLRRIIAKEAMRFQFLMQSHHLTDIEKRQYEALIGTDRTGAFTMSDELLKDSLLTLSQLLQKHYGQNAIVLIDEYDVPLDQAYRFGYYDAMTELIKSLFGGAFKTNDSLYFAVLTGCLRISKESIFTGLNNFNVYSVKNVQYHEYFGFTDAEVQGMLAYYGFTEKYSDVRAWYDGYRFGELDIYCPWDVVSHCHALKMDLSVKPQNYWVNTSSNDIIRRFLGRAKTTTRDEIERLIDGESVKKRLHEELTYRDLDSDIDYLWSILFTTGYLTGRTAGSGEETELVIPNKEIRWIFIWQIREWFKDEVQKNSERLERLRAAFEENDAGAVEQGLNEYLADTISIRDTGARTGMKESFYRGMLLGLFAHMDGWSVRSNAESGEGYSDIGIEIRNKGIGIVIEIKYAENAAFEKKCREAVRQIRDRGYEKSLVKSGMTTVYCYGIACYKKQCRIVAETLITEHL